MTSEGTYGGLALLAVMRPFAGALKMLHRISETRKTTIAIAEANERPN